MPLVWGGRIRERAGGSRGRPGAPVTLRPINAQCCRLSERIRALWRYCAEKGGGGMVRRIFSSLIVGCVFVLVLFAGTAGAAPVAAKKKVPSTTPALSGIASVYAYKKRSRSASGEFTNFKSLVAAHRTLRFGTQVRVTNR